MTKFFSVISILWIFENTYGFIVDGDNSILLNAFNPGIRDFNGNLSAPQAAEAAKVRLHMENLRPHEEIEYEKVFIMIKKENVKGVSEKMTPKQQKSKNDELASLFKSKFQNMLPEHLKSKKIIGAAFAWMVKEEGRRFINQKYSLYASVVFVTEDGDTYENYFGAGFHILEGHLRGVQLIQDLWDKKCNEARVNAETNLSNWQEKTPLHDSVKTVTRIYLTENILLNVANALQTYKLLLTTYFKNGIPKDLKPEALAGVGFAIKIWKEDNGEEIWRIRVVIILMKGTENLPTILQTFEKATNDENERISLTEEECAGFIKGVLENKFSPRSLVSIKVSRLEQAKEQECAEAAANKIHSERLNPMSPVPPYSTTEDGTHILRMKVKLLSLQGALRAPPPADYNIRESDLVRFNTDITSIEVKGAEAVTGLTVKCKLEIEESPHHYFTTDEKVVLHKTIQNAYILRVTVAIRLGPALEDCTPELHMKYKQLEKGDERYKSLRFKILTWKENDTDFTEIKLSSGNTGLKELRFVFSRLLKYPSAKSGGEAENGAQTLATTEVKGLIEGKPHSQEAGTTILYFKVKLMRMEGLKKPFPVVYYSTKTDVEPIQKNISEMKLNAGRKITGFGINGKIVLETENFKLGNFQQYQTTYSLLVVVVIKTETTGSVSGPDFEINFVQTNMFVSPRYNVLRA